MSPELMEQIRSGQAADIPAASSAKESADYAAMAQQLHDALRAKGLNPEERAASPEGKIASALWQRVAEWDEAQDEKDK